MKHLADAIGIAAIWISLAVMFCAMAKCNSDNYRARQESCKGAAACVD